MQTIYLSYENFYKNTFSRYLMFYGTDARLQYIIAGKMCIVVSLREQEHFLLIFHISH